MRYAITNSRAVLPDGVADDLDVIVEDGAITELKRPGGAALYGFEILDARGGFLLPGFIDIHADYIERMAAPRPTSIMDLGMSLREAERELATHGITTMFHSLALYGVSDFDVKPIRDPENTRKFIDIIDGTSASSHLIRHFFHARFEIDNLARTGELEGYLRSRRVHLVSFMDHSPGQGQYRDLEVYRKTLKGYRDLSDGDVDRIIEERSSSAKLSESRIRELAALAREARRLGMKTVAGAPNVLLGGSHSGNLSAREAILDGSIDILCSDYYPAAILHAIFKLHRDDGLDLAYLVRLATLNPAEAVGMGNEIGSIEVGKKADLIVVEAVDGIFPACTSVLVGGRRVISCEYGRAA